MHEYRNQVLEIKLIFFFLYITKLCLNGFLYQIKTFLINLQINKINILIEALQTVLMKQVFIFNVNIFVVYICISCKYIFSIFVKFFKNKFTIQEENIRFNKRKHGGKVKI